MSRERLYLFDTTLRDGQQSQGVDFSVEDKLRIARALDGLGIEPRRVPNTMMTRRLGAMGGSRQGRRERSYRMRYGRD